MRSEKDYLIHPLEKTRQEEETMTQDKAVIVERAHKIIAEITRAMEEHLDFHDAGRLVSSIVDHVVQEDRDLIQDRYIRRFIFDAAQTLATKPWEKESDILDRLPPYGFRRDDELLQWAHWFASHRKRALSINRFLLEVQGTQIKQSVHDLMYETFRYEQKSVASKVIGFLKDDTHWE